MRYYLTCFRCRDDDSDRQLLAECYECLTCIATQEDGRRALIGGAGGVTQALCVAFCRRGDGEHFSRENLLGYIYVYIHYIIILSEKLRSDMKKSRWLHCRGYSQRAWLGPSGVSDDAVWCRDVVREPVISGRPAADTDPPLCQRKGQPPT